MTTENEVPELRRVYGLLVSEWVTYTMIVMAVVAVFFGFQVGTERDTQAERAMATLDALTEEAERAVAGGRSLICDDTLLDADRLANDYLTLSIRPAPIDEDDASAGFGPALHVDVVEKEVSGDTWDTAKRLMALVKKADGEAAKGSEARSRSVDGEAARVAAGDADADGDGDKPKGRLRNVRKKSFGEKVEYLRYDILASTVATCRQDA